MTDDLLGYGVALERPEGDPNDRYEIDDYGALHDTLEGAEQARDDLAEHYSHLPHYNPGHKLFVVEVRRA